MVFPVQNAQLILIPLDKSNPLKNMLKATMLSKELTLTKNGLLILWNSQFVFDRSFPKKIISARYLTKGCKGV